MGYGDDVPGAPAVDSTQANSSSAISIKAAEQLEQFKLQAKIKEEKVCVVAVFILVQSSSQFQTRKRLYFI